MRSKGVNFSFFYKISTGFLTGITIIFLLPNQTFRKLSSVYYDTIEIDDAPLDLNVTQKEISNKEK